MRLCERDRKILQLLWRCGGGATAAQLTHQVWDRGRDNSRFRERLKRLVDHHYIAVLPFPRSARATTLGLPKHCYVLEERGAAAIGQAASRLDEQQAGECILRSEVIRQLNCVGYQLESPPARPETFLPEVPLFHLYGSANRLLVLWCPAPDGRLAHRALKQVAATSLDPLTTSLLFAFTEVSTFLAFKSHISTTRFLETCAFECLAVFAREVLPVGSIGEPVPFDGWYDRLLPEG